MPLGSKVASKGGSSVLHRVILKNIKKSSKTKGVEKSFGTEIVNNILVQKSKSHTALIFGVKHHLVAYYKDCSNYVPRMKKGPASIIDR